MSNSVPSMQDLLGAGVHFGHQVRRGHPKMGQFIYGARDGVHIIDLAKSEEQLKKALEFVENLGKEGKVLLVVGTKKQAKEIIENLSKEAGAPYLSESWIGGLLTNFEEIRRNIKTLLDLKKEKEQGLLSRYTKKEQMLIDRKLAKFNKIYRGIENLEKLPDAIFIVDCVAEKTAVREAVQKEIPLVGLNDTNSDPSLIDYPIPGNDDGIKSIKIICEAVIGAYGAGRKIGVKSEESKTEETQKKTEVGLKKVKGKKDETSDEVTKETGERMDETKEEVEEEVADIEEKIEKKSLEEAERKI